MSDLTKTLRERIQELEAQQDITNHDNMRYVTSFDRIKNLEIEVDQLKHRCSILKAVLHEIISKYRDDRLPPDIAMFSIYEMARRALEREDVRP